MHADGHWVSLSVRDLAGAVEFIVANPGQIPDPGHFEAFAKGETSEGHGLGLAIIRDQAERHGLSLILRDDIGPETAFHLTVPKAA